MLGQRLVANGTISAAQLQAALEEQRATGGLIGEVLLKLSFIAEDGLSKGLAQEAGVPFMAIDRMEPDPSAVALVPELFARKHLVAPLGLNDAMLEVLQANPFDVVTIDELQRVAGHPAQVVCGTRSDVLRMIERSYDRHRGMPGFPQVYGEKIAVRIRQKDALIRSLEDLGFNRRNLALFRDALRRSHGIVLVTGPTDAGKTTTLYSALAYLRGDEKNILTVEDPIEDEIPAVRQIQVRPEAGFSFATGIRSLLRQDPDVIMVSEIQDLETAQLAFRAALSGVLVLSTLDATDSAGALHRLMDMGLEPYLLASGVVAVIAQRLVRLICPHCKAPAIYTAETLDKVGLVPDPDMVLPRGQGCERCSGSGYSGRTGVFEILTMDAGIHALIRERAGAPRIKAAAVKSGMKSLMEDALSKAIFGQTTIEEVLRVAYE